ncbi:unnamed protein product, partial [marine sediment metagenome]
MSSFKSTPSFIAGEIRTILLDLFHSSIISPFISLLSWRNVLNPFAMLITNTYLDGDYQFSKRNLLIVDECHSLESQIAGM